MYKTYGPFGALARTVDAAGNVVRVKTDALGNVVKLDDPSAGTRIRTFDSFGMMLTEQVRGRAEKDISFTYNGFGEVLTPTRWAERLDLWLRQCGSDGEQLIAGRVTARSWSYAPDNGLLTAQSLTLAIDGESIENFETAFTYNGAGQLATLSYPGATHGAPAVHYSYRHGALVRLADLMGQHQPLNGGVRTPSHRRAL